MSMINEILKSAVDNVQKEKNEFDVKKWAEQKNEKRQWAYQTQDEMAIKITEEGGLYKTYLDVQSRFPSYSAGNVLLITAQNPEVTQLRDIDGWNKDNIYFARKPNPITIIEPSNVYTREDGTEAQGYDTKSVYDISDMRTKKQLNTIPYTDENILKAVISISPVQVKVVETTFSNKLVNFNVGKRIIEVTEDIEVKEIISGLVRELASIHLRTYENSELNNFKNESVAYMINKRYGIPTSNYNFEKIPEELKYMTPQEIKAELSKTAECFEILTEKIDRDLGINIKTKANKDRER